ncbi:uncharacterized protein ALTATR162_LOCUS9405 [Alternaria atra]|uniref:Uncharacterized protein n=1 Tax=Alternaria atra TaxID=119953 RepID=A0A8J2N9R2_9PLEO|nr:uncharacterized protein ALTATR162_LOCUS9405 [Alternaria atra]CAG5180778.1 unnamed protein product [Alternaria atra]
MATPSLTPFAEDGFPGAYTLICPELNQKDTPFYREGMSRLFETKNEAWLYSMFVKPTPEVGRIQSFHPPSGDLFDRLPNEIIDEIFDYVLADSYIQDGASIRHNEYLVNRENRKIAREDFIALGLSSARLWPLVLNRLHRSYRKHHWAGRKVGFHAVHSKFTAEQMKNYGIEGTKYMGDERMMSRAQQSVEDWKWDYFSTTPDGEWVDIIDHPINGYSSERAFKMSKYELETRPDDREKIRRDLKRTNLHITERDWVLRNLTTRQYVRSDQLEEPEEPASDWREPPKAREPLLSNVKRFCKDLTQQMRKNSKDKRRSEPEKNSPLTLAIIFLFLTCSAPNTWYHFERMDSPKRYLNFEDGPWAGCAFDIIPLEDHLQSWEQTDNIWLDVSREVVADIANLRFCICRYHEMRTWGHKHYVSDHNPTAYSVYWDDYWANVTRTRKLHRQWVRTCPPRPWIDESMYTPT